MDPIDTATSQTFLLTKPDEGSAIVVEETEVRSSSPSVDEDGDTEMGRTSETEASDRSGRRLRGFRTSRTSGEDLLKAYQEQIDQYEKESKNWKLEKQKLDIVIRDLEHHRRFQDDIIDQRQAELQAAESRASKEIQLAEKKSRQEISKAKGKVKEVEDLIATLQVSLEEHQRENRRLEQELKEARLRLKKRDENSKQVTRQLQDAQDHIFRLQPRRTMVTETEAEQEFEELYNGIVRWVQNRLDGILNELDDGHLQNRTCPADEANRILSFTCARAREDFLSDQSDEYHVTAIIMQYLCVRMFSTDFYCTLDYPTQDGKPSEDLTMATIIRIGKAMSRTDRGRTTCSAILLFPLK
jgi:hypothetical protein